MASPLSPRILKAGLVLLDPATSAVKSIIVLQYNPDSLSRNLTPQSPAGEGADRSAALRYKGPPIETIRMEAEVDAADQLEHPDQAGSQEALSVLPILSAIETILYPASSQLIADDRLAQVGSLNIIPLQAPLTLFVWSRNRIVPVRITGLSVTEEAFDANLNPIRARINLDMRVLSVSDLGFDQKGGTLYMTYQQRKEQLAHMIDGKFGPLGIGGIP
jgi:hypothetical protein